MTEISHEALLTKLAQLKAQAEAATPGPWRGGDWTATFGTVEQEITAIERAPGIGPFPTIRQRDDEADLVLTIEDGFDDVVVANVRHIAAWHPGMALAVITAAEETLREHRPIISVRIGVPYCGSEEHERGWPDWDQCPHIERLASWVMPKEGE